MRYLLTLIACLTITACSSTRAGPAPAKAPALDAGPAALPPVTAPKVDVPALPPLAQNKAPRSLSPLDLARLQLAIEIANRVCQQGRAPLDAEVARITPIYKIAPTNQPPTAPSEEGR